VMMILAEGKKGGAVDPVLQFHAKDVTVESDRSLEVGYLQVHVADISHRHVLSFHRTKTLQPDETTVSSRMVKNGFQSRSAKHSPIRVSPEVVTAG
jgi:hypothetical protein